jgi:flagellin-like hook-associated protein FlgL
VSAAKTSIGNTDFAVETAELIRGQIIQQASIAELDQVSH